MIWSRPGLPVRDRSMITVAMLAALGHPRSCAPTSPARSTSGSSRDELVEVLMQVAVYAGVPAAVAALRAAADVLGTDE